MAARYTTYLRLETNESDNDGPVWNEEDTTPTDENKPVLCKNCPDQKMLEVSPGLWKCPICDFIDFR